MHRYSIRYIARSGRPDKITVMASGKSEAQRIAERRGIDNR